MVKLWLLIYMSWVLSGGSVANADILTPHELADKKLKQYAAEHAEDTKKLLKKIEQEMDYYAFGSLQISIWGCSDESVQQVIDILRAKNWKTEKNKRRIFVA